MNRSARLTVEALEARALLSGLSVSVATDKAVYQPGQPIHMTFTETNASSQPVTVDWGPSTDGFLVERNGVVVWQSNAGINPMFVAANTLDPGKSLTLAATWDGIPSGQSSAPAGGKYVVFNQLDKSGAVASFRIGADPSSLGTAPGQASPPPSPVPNPPVPPSTSPGAASPIAISVSTGQPTIMPGHSVRFSVALRNAGNRDLNLTPDPSADGLTLWKGSTLVWRSRGVHVPKMRTLHHGQAMKLTTLWNGRPNQPGVPALSPGTYTLQAEESGSTGSTTVSIGGPR
jgi:hypothetical protein